MIKREMTEDALLKMGMPAGISGFVYIADAVEILEKDFDVQTTKGLYPEIAKKRNTTGLKVERAIRYAIVSVRDRGRAEWVEHYVGLDNCSNTNFLKKLTSVLKKESRRKTAKENKTLNEEGWYLEDSFLMEIRKILREEIELAFGLKGVETDVNLQKPDTCRGWNWNAGNSLSVKKKSRNQKERLL